MRSRPLLPALLLIACLLAPLAPAQPLVASAPPAASQQDVAPAPRAVTAGTAAHIWQIETVESAGTPGDATSLAIGGSGVPHVAYYDATLSRVRHGARTGGTWSRDTVATAVATGATPSLALGPGGLPYVAYLDGADVTLATYNGSMWSPETVHSSPLVRFTTLAVDGGGDATLCWHERAVTHYAGALLCARPGAAAPWQVETVDATGVVGAYPSVALDAGGGAHVSYLDVATQALKYASRGRSTWISETVDIGVPVGGHTALALDGANRPHISYEVSGTLKYARHDGSRWISETVDSGNVGQYTALALDVNGLPHISYYDAGSGAVTYAHHDGSRWQVETVDTGPVGGTLALAARTSIALDAAGRPHISYHDAGTGAVKVATPDAYPPIIMRGPAVAPEREAATVTWTTNESADGRVRYGMQAGVYDDQGYLPALTTDHSLVLTGLTPATVYHYVVQSTDAAGNTVTSAEGFFETLPAEDDEPPALASLSLARVPGFFDVLRAGATVSDTQGVQRVEYRFDGLLAGIAYGPDWGRGMLFSPPGLGVPSGTFSGTHTLRVTAVDQAGLHTDLPIDVTLFAPLNGELAFIAPDASHVLYVEGDTVPPGTVLNIGAYATEYAWDCQLAYMLSPPDLMAGPPLSAASTEAGDNGPGLSVESMYGMMQPPWCHEVDRAVDHVDFLVDDVHHHTATPTSDDDFDHVYAWDISGLPTGSYRLKIHSVLSDGTEGIRVRDVQIARGVPSVAVHRRVSRIRNSFVVTMTVENVGTGALQLHEIEDHLRAFQAISATYGSYLVQPTYSVYARTCDVPIEMQATVVLDPGEDTSLVYRMVPLLYPDPWPSQYAVGQEPVIVRYTGNAGPVEQSINHQTHTTVEGETDPVGLAHHAANYLIVSNVEHLHYANASLDVLNQLYASMAELAHLKNGVLGYVAGSYGAHAGNIRNVAHAWGASMTGSDGTPGGYLSSGYLLLVGEVEVLGTYHSTHKKGAQTRHVDYTDLPYANTSGDWTHPELMVSRIVGDTAEELLIPIQTSIRVHRGWTGYSYDRSHALAVAGAGDGASKFESNVDTVTSRLFNEFSVVKLKKREVEGGGGNITDEFKAYDADRDMLYYRDHCNPWNWSGVIGTADFDDPFVPVDFGGSKPFAFACCCQAGRYESGSDTSIVEEFLQHGAGLYIGSTEDSMRDKNNDASKWFFDHWVNHTQPVAAVLRSLRRNLGGFEGDYWNAEYQLFGDTKYDVFAPTNVQAAAPSNAAAADALDLHVPDYEVTQVDGHDVVSIPGGHHLDEPGQPLVPIYTYEVVYPAGTRVQAVTLTQRSGLTTSVGLDLPASTVEWDCERPAETSVSRNDAADDGAAWWPQETFTWSVHESAGGGSTLKLTVYPFFAHAPSATARFYQDYSFDIELAESNVEVALLTTDRGIYLPNQDVVIDAWVNNTGEALDALAGVVVRDEATGDVVEGMPLRSLKALAGAGWFSEVWNAGDQPDGAYLVELTVYDEDANVLDRETTRIQLSPGRVYLPMITKG